MNAFGATVNGSSRTSPSELEIRCGKKNAVSCKFLRGAIPEPWREGAELLEMVTGLPFDADALRRAARRIAALRHCFNAREGWTAAEDRLPDRFLDEPLDGAVVPRDDLAAMIAGYHAARGHAADGGLDERTRRELEMDRWLADSCPLQAPGTVG